MFETGEDEWKYSSDVGTAFVINFQNRFFAITCKHVLGTYSWSQLVLTNDKFGDKIAGVKAVFLVGQTFGAATDSEIRDIAVIEFTNDVDATFFRDSSYVFDSGTVGSSQNGDKLSVNGALKDPSYFTEQSIVPVFCKLEFEDIGAKSNDVTLREGLARFENFPYSRLTGISGSPVFNLTKRRLCGVVVRAGIDNSGFAHLHYVDVFDIEKLLQGILNRSLNAVYLKDILQN